MKTAVFIIVLVVLWRTGLLEQGLRAVGELTGWGTTCGPNEETVYAAAGDYCAPKDRP